MPCVFPHPYLRTPYVCVWYVCVCVCQGYGTFNAIDYAIALDVIQEGADSAKDLGLWNLSLSIPVRRCAGRTTKQGFP